MFRRAGVEVAAQSTPSDQSLPTQGLTLELLMLLGIMMFVLTLGTRVEMTGIRSKTVLVGTPMLDIIAALIDIETMRASLRLSLQTFLKDLLPTTITQIGMR